MPKNPNKIIAVGTAKRTLEQGSREYERMRSYAERLGEFHVVVLTRTSDSLPEHIVDGNLHVHGTNARSKLGMVGSAILMIRRILREPGDWTVTAQDPFEIAFIAWCATLGQRVRRQAQIHGDVFNPRFGSGLMHSVRTRFARWYLRRVDSVRVVSGRIKRSVSACGIPAERITVLPIQADIQSFLAVGEDRTYPTTGPIKFLYVGRFSPEKNLPLLLHAFADHLQKHPISELRLVGAGGQQAELLRLVSRLDIEDQVRFVPWTDDVPQTMAEADVFCLASRHEGWAMVAVEAAAAGLPVIMSDVGCAGEFIIDGQQGRVVPVDDRAAFTAALDGYAERPETLARHGSNGHRSARAWALDESEYYDRWVEAVTS